jgi:hypothetical protein
MWLGTEVDRGRLGKRIGPPSDDDWRLAAATLARYCPGLGDPMSMTVPELMQWNDTLSAVLEREFGKPSNGQVDHRARVEAEMRRIHG